MGADREPIRLVGRVREVSSPPPGTWSVTIDGEEVMASRAGWIVVEVEGREIRVELEDTACGGDRTLTGKGAWSELAAQIPLPANHAAPFKATKFEAVTPQVGDAVDLYGIVLARGDVEEGYREAPRSTVTHARAQLLTRGANASKLLDRVIRDKLPMATRPIKRDPRLDDKGNPLNRPPAANWIMCIVAVIAAIVSAVLEEPFAALGFAGCAVIARPRRIAREFRTRDEQARSWFFDLFSLGAWAWLFPLALFVVIGESNAYHRSIVEPIWVLGACLIALAATRELGPYGRLLSGTPWEGTLGDDLVVEGVVRDPTPVAIGSVDAAVGREATYDRGIGSSPDTLISKKYLNDKTYFVDAKSGVVEIDPEETIWASTVVKTTEGGTFSVSEVIPIGGKIIAVGSIVEGQPPRLRAKGTRPAIVMATSEYGDPRGLARAIVNHHFVTLAGLVAVGVISALLLVIR